MDPLWVDKYRPRSLQRLHHHPSITQVLSQLASTQDFPHIIFYGPEGAGKKTRAYAFLHKLFGENVFKIKEEERVVKPEGSSVTVEFSIFSSNHHMQMTPSDNEHHDRHIVQSVVKEIAGNNNVQSKNNRGPKVLVINEADKLTKQAQGGLRRTMEKYMKNCRMILLCTHVHKLIDPIRSRCLNIRVPAPDQATITQILTDIGKAESVNTHYFSFTPQLASSIANNCNRNLRLAIIQLQASKFTKNVDGMLAPYKKEIKEIAQLIIKEQNPQQVKRIREKFYDLLVNCIDGQTILKELLKQLVSGKNLRQQGIKDLVHQAAEHERTLMCGSKAIYHLESFAVHAMEQVVIAKNYRMMTE